MASANGHVHVVHYLTPHLSLSQINHENSDGNTALHWACMNQHVNVTQALIESGSNPLLKNHGGRDSLFEAESRKNETLILLLLKNVELEEGKNMESGSDGIEETEGIHEEIQKEEVEKEEGRGFLDSQPLTLPKIIIDVGTSPQR